MAYLKDIGLAVGSGQQFIGLRIAHEFLSGGDYRLLKEFPSGLPVLFHIG